MTEVTEDPLVARAQERVGTVLKEKWRLDALLGVGGMAAVYAATHRNKKRGAVKMLHAELSVEPTIRDRFLREGYVANSVEHQGAVRVDDDDIAEDGSAFLVMELLEGETVESRAQRKGGRLPVAEVLSIADQLLDVLASAHERGIVHRDLKPENLFLTKEGVLKVLDFGIARLRESDAKSSATQTGSLMGTPAFMAPEQARGRWTDVDAQTDLWAVGATMFTLLTGRLVFEAETANEMLGMAMMQHAPSVASVLPELQRSVVAVVDRALLYDKTARFQNATEMQEAVRAAYHDTQGTDVGRAPALSVPDAPVAGPGLTLTGVPARPANLTTARGVTTATGPARRTGPPVALLVAGGGLALLLGIVIVAWIAMRESSQTAPDLASTGVAPSAVPATAETPPEPVVTPKAEASPDDPEVVSVDELPVAKPSEKKPVATKPATGSTPAKPTAPKPTATKEDPFAKRR